MWYVIPHDIMIKVHSKNTCIEEKSIQTFYNVPIQRYQPSTMSDVSNPNEISLYSPAQELWDEN